MHFRVIDSMKRFDREVSCIKHLVLRARRGLGDLKLKTVESRISSFQVVFLLMLVLSTMKTLTAETTPPTCDGLPHADHPKATVSNGLLNAVVFLPDVKSGYYRGARFDWAGVVGCLSYKGRTYFGEWFREYDPLLHDAITGPVEEFRSNDGGIGYGEAKPGGLFVKPG